MGELCDQLDRLGSIQTTSRQAEPAAASQDDAEADPEEAMATFHVFIASENQGHRKYPRANRRVTAVKQKLPGPRKCFERYRSAGNAT